MYTILHVFLSALVGFSRYLGYMWACASPAFVGILKITGFIPSTIYIGEHL